MGHCFESAIVETCVDTFLSRGFEVMPLCSRFLLACSICFLYQRGCASKSKIMNHMRWIVATCHMFLLGCSNLSLSAVVEYTSKYNMHVINLP